VQLFWLGVGAAASLLTGILVRQFSRQRAADFYTAFMAATAFIYVGASLGRGDLRVLVMETVIAVVLFNLTLAGLWRSLAFTAIAFILHGAWDLLHLLRGWGAEAGESFPALCIAYDWVIAGFVWSLREAKTSQTYGR